MAGKYMSATDRAMAGLINRNPGTFTAVKKRKPKKKKKGSK